MRRKLLNASRLQAEVSRRIHHLPEVADDGVKIVVPRPQLQPPDASGCNWTMKPFGHAAGFEKGIAAVLARVRAEYNLADESDPGRVGSDPFGGPGASNAGSARKRPVDPFKA
ncbi:hypothetical protein [Burkholderia sp. WAC0059]|uniref:hypothetical protein n=1 Tax=Burkholderia sp. WAC0059 TaxID=2066022 RepID=UPI0021550A9C|nr:hypothetical protein [Burkholderia sp. WAC0059]